MTLEEYHAEEERLRELFKRKYPTDAILKVFFPSTYAAVTAFWNRLRILEIIEKQKRENKIEEMLK
jgi:hypothetical protein